MAKKIMSGTRKGDALFYAGIAIIVAIAASLSATILVLAILLAPLAVKALSAVMLSAIALMVVGAYMGNK